MTPRKTLLTAAAICLLTTPVLAQVDPHHPEAGIAAAPPVLREHG